MLLENGTEPIIPQLIGMEEVPTTYATELEALEEAEETNPCRKRRLIHLNKARVFLNGELIGTHDKPKELTMGLRKKRRIGEIRNR